MQSLTLFARRQLGRAAAGFIVLALPLAGLAQTNTAATIAVQPVGDFAGFGEDYLLSVQPAGTPPFTYQWYFNGSAVAGQTNASFWQTNLTAYQVGSYLVVVSNSLGGTNSLAVSLTVQTNVPRRIANGRLLQVGTQVGLPITLRANGREKAVSFSLSYNTNALSGPVFLPVNTNGTAAVDLSVPGSVGVALTQPAGTTFPEGNQWVGLVRFDLAAGADPLQAGLAFVAVPTPIAAVNSNAIPLSLSASIQPQYVLVTSNATLNYQSGLFQQQLLIGNPGAATLTNVDIMALGLTADTQTNLITFFNSQVSITNLPFFGDQILPVPCSCLCGASLDVPLGGCDLNSYLACGAGNCGFNTLYTNSLLSAAQIANLLPGELRAVTAEFYVTDHLTVPQPVYSVFAVDAIPPVTYVNATGLTITTNRFVNGAFLIEFPTQLGLRYYVQYAGSPDQLTNPAAVKTAYPPVIGTGSHVQWTDNGPPRTDSPPTNGARFYQVLQSQ